MNELVDKLCVEKICHVLPHEAGDGPTNMAIDEALLEAVAAGAAPGFLRTYDWMVPTLSLGYFQQLAEALADPRFRGAPLVRRLTGGGALWHHHEITYALVIPADHPLAHPSTELYRAVHDTIARALLDHGVRAKRRGDDDLTAHVYEKRPLLCFTDSDPEDIVSGGIKIVGSAQRRRGGAVLQHGSLLLARSSQTPELLGIHDITSESASIHHWSNELRDRIPRALGLRRVDVEVRAGIRTRAIELTVERYQAPAWTGRR